MPDIILSDNEAAKETLAPKNTNTPQEQEEVLRLMTEVRAMYELKNQKWREFNDRTLQQYEDDNQKRINSYVEPRSEDIDDWQTRGFEGITREKMFAFVSKVAMERPKYKFKATNKDGFIDKVVSEVVSDIYDYTWLFEDPVGTQFFFDAWAAAGSGTCIRYEGVEQTEEILEEFESYDVTTGEMTGLTERSVKSDINCKAERVPLREFLWKNWYEPDIQKQPIVARVVDMTREQFEAHYGHYKNAGAVPNMKHLKELNDGSFFASQWDSIAIDRVQVVHVYEKGTKSKYRIIANGILILATPIPRKDGMLPFTRGICKPFADSRFFCGKALPDEIASDQDVYNAMKNMVVDRAILYVQRPMIGSNLTEIENEIFRPSGILNVKGGELKTMDYQPPNQEDIQILEYLRAAANRQTSDITQSGQTGSGVTAREIVIADENARKLAGVFRIFLEEMDLLGARLRVGNIMQFFFEPTKLEEIEGTDKASEFNLAYRSFSLDNRKLSDNKNGTKVINIVGKREDLPTPEEQDVKEAMAKMQGYELEGLTVTSQYVKNFNVDLLIIPESSFEQSKSLALAKEGEYLTTVAKLMPNKLMQYEDVFFKQLNETYDKDQSEFENAKPAPTTNPSLGFAGGMSIGGGGGPSPIQQLAPNNSNSLAKMVGAKP